MNYNSATFWLLFLAVLLPYWYLPHRRQNQLLLVASYIFYGFWDYRFLFLVLVSTYIDYIGGLGVAGILLPAGISFYTFQAMSYTIDIYRGDVEPTENFPDFALFVCFFPHLVAGPIMRAHTLLPQVVQPRRLEAGAI